MANGNAYSFSKYIKKNPLFKKVHTAALSVLSIACFQRVPLTHQVTFDQSDLLRLQQLLPSGGDELKRLPAVHQRLPDEFKECRQTVPGIKRGWKRHHALLNTVQLKKPQNLYRF